MDNQEVTYEIELVAKEAEVTTHFFDNNYYGDDKTFPVVSIRGYPPCPVCLHKYLTLREFQEGECYWHCASCGTEWDVMDLIEAMSGGKEQ